MGIYSTPLAILKKEKYGLIAFPFDIVTSETHNLDSLVTTHVREDGSDISDHVQNKLRRWSITGVVSDYSIYATLSSTTSLADNITNVSSSTRDTLGNKTTRSQQAYDALVNAWKKREVLTITTSLGAHTDVVISNISIPRNPDNQWALEFTINFQEVPRVTLLKKEITSAQIVGDTSTDLGLKTSSVVNKGSQTGTP